MSSQQTDPDEARRDDYFRRVERHFGLRRDGPLLLSPRDWQVVERWYDRGIPLDTVLRGINRAFDRFDATGATAARVNSLSYCKQQVEAAWEEQGQLQTFSDAGAAADGNPAVEHLKNTADACRLAADAAPELANALRAAATALDRLAVEAGVLVAAELDRRANAIESRFRDAIASRGGSRNVRLPRFSPWHV